MSGERPVVVAERPAPGAPRPYDFPAFDRRRLDNGLTVIGIHLPGRALVSATLVNLQGAADEAAEAGGATLLMARGLAEGTEQYDAIELTEAAERLGASLHAEAGWDAFTAGVDVPAERLGPALELLAEMVGRPTFPEGEIERLRDERLNDILQAAADPRRRADEAFSAAVYAPASPYARPAGGLRETVERIDADRLRGLHSSAFDPASMTLIVGGDLTGHDVPAIADLAFGAWRARGKAHRSDVVADARSTERRVVVVHRPGSVQTEIRIGHPGVARRIADYHAVSVMSAILGGLFNSRCNLKLREEKGYTYGAGAGFDMRRGRGPFSARAAVNTDVTVPATIDLMGELDRMRDGDVTPAELAAARDFLVGVFPLRFETPGPVVGAIAGLVIHDLPDDELSTYRPGIESVTIPDVRAAAVSRILPAEAAVVLVGDADAFLPALEAAAVGPVEVVDDAAAGGGAAG
jgi:zinc protease